MEGEEVDEGYFVCGGVSMAEGSYCLVGMGNGRVKEGKVGMGRCSENIGVRQSVLMAAAGRAAGSRVAFGADSRCFA